MAHRAPLSELRYGLASREDGAVCNDLNNGFFKRNRSLAQWEWEFAPPHLPFDEIAYAVSRDGDKIVGTQGLIIVPMLSERGAFWTAKGEDTIVHPRYWGRDALIEMYKVLFEFCERNDIRLLWGFNSKKGSFSRAGFEYFDDSGVSNLFRAFGRHALDAVLKDTVNMKKRFERPGGELAKAAISAVATTWADARTLLSRTTRTLAGRAPRNLIVEELQGPPGQEFDVLSHRFVQRHGGITLHRTAAFVAWRLLNNPFRTSTILTARKGGGLCGYVAVALAEDGEAHISDQFVCATEGGDSGDDVVLETLIDATASLARARGARFLHANAFNAHKADASFRRAMRRLGFMARMSSIDACYRILPGSGMLPEGVSSYRNWYITSMNTEGRSG